jgi:hypothetical protein
LSRSFACGGCSAAQAKTIDGQGHARKEKWPDATTVTALIREKLQTPCSLARIDVMPLVDDPFLALILRFVVDTEAPDRIDAEFLERQLKAMRQYLARFPEAEHASRAMEWIGQHAARYRKDWERKTVTSRTIYLRCADCPLADLGAADQCEIHEQWSYLMHRYLTGEVTSREHIESALALLRQYKDQLRVRTLGVTAAPDDVKEAKKGKKHKDGKKRKKKKKDKGKKKKNGR